ncbi:hypothetical protein LXL04_019699 [Taraxacum kok-saghyz]
MLKNPKRYCNLKKDAKNANSQLSTIIISATSSAKSLVMKYLKQGSREGFVGKASSAALEALSAEKGGDCISWKEEVADNA